MTRKQKTALKEQEFRRQLHDLVTHLDPKSFREWFQYFVANQKSSWDTIHRKNLLNWNVIDSEKFQVCFETHEIRKASMEVQKIIASGIEENTSALLSLYMTSKLVGEGLKIFCPTQEQCEALEVTEPRFPCQEYQQPFQTFTIELPRGYQKKRLVQGDGIFGQLGDELPLGVVVRREVNALLVMIPLSNHSTFTNAVPLWRDESLSVALDKAATQRMDIDKQKSCDDSESTLITLVTRLAVNACSLLVHFGTTRSQEEKDLRSQRNQLQRDLKRARERGQGIQEAEQELNCHPTFWGFDQSITLFDRLEVSEDHQPLEDQDQPRGGWRQRPHWRPGCWVQQPHGEGSLLRKRIFRKPVLVHPNLLVGPASATTVTVLKK